jgi:guanosine-3',5'-bis(diphosphate) 3'-pyrophosphohydrolase
MINSEQLLSKIKSYNKFSSIEPLSKAFNFAVEAHKNQKRFSGSPYVVHPVAVADILAELKLDSATIITGLLHDTIEDTKTTYQVVLR